MGKNKSAQWCYDDWEQEGHWNWELSPIANSDYLGVTIQRTLWQFISHLKLYVFECINLVSAFKLPRLVPHKQKVIGKRYRLYCLHVHIINLKNAWWKNECMVYCFLKETSLEEKNKYFLAKDLIESIKCILYHIFQAYISIVQG